MGASPPAPPPPPPQAAQQSPFFLIGREDAKNRKKKRGIRSQTLLDSNSNSKSPSGGKSLLGEGG